MLHCVTFVKLEVKWSVLNAVNYFPNSKNFSTFKGYYGEYYITSKIQFNQQSKYLNA